MASKIWKWIKLKLKLRSWTTIETSGTIKMIDTSPDWFDQKWRDQGWYYRGEDEE